MAASLRIAEPRDAEGIAAVHVAAWRAAYAVALWVLEGNRGARRFYEVVGFVVEALGKVDEATGLRVVRYQKPLAR